MHHHRYLMRHVMYASLRTRRPKRKKASKQASRKSVTAVTYREKLALPLWLALTVLITIGVVATLAPH